MRLFILFSISIIFTLTIQLTSGGIFRRYVRKHRPGHHHRIGPHHIMARSRGDGFMWNGPPLIERQFRMSQFRPWPSFVRRSRVQSASPSWPQIMYNYPLQMPLMPRRASRRYRGFYERLDNARVPQFHHHQPRHQQVPIGISTTTRLPTTSAIQWRPMDFGNPIDRDPTYDYAPPAIERVRFVSEVRGGGGGRHPTARANHGMLGMYSRPSPVIVPAPWSKRNNNGHIRARHPGIQQQQQQQQQHHVQLQQGTVQHQQHVPPQPPPRGMFPLWKYLAHKQRPRRPQRPAPGMMMMRPGSGVSGAGAGAASQMRFIGQDPAHPLYHHQVFQDEAEVVQHIPNIVYFQPTDVKNGKRNEAPKKSLPGLKPGLVTNAELYSSESSSSSEFRPVVPTSVTSAKKVTHHPNHHKDYKFTVVGYHGPAATTPMSPVAQAPTTKRTPTVLYAVKTTPETLSTTHNSAVRPLEPTESLEPQDGVGEEVGEASELKPVHMLPENEEMNVDGREQGGVDVDFENEDDDSSGLPVVPNSFNVFESLLSSFEKEFGGDDSDKEEEEVVEVKDTHHHRDRNPVFAPTEDSLDTPVVAQETSTSAGGKNFETSTSISVSVGVSSHSSSSSKKAPSPSPPKSSTIEDVLSKLDEEEDEDGASILDEIFAIRTAPTTARPTTTTTSTSTTTTTERPVTTTTTELTTTTQKTTTSTAYPRLPTMPTYKRKPTPVYSRKSSKAGGLLTKYSSSSSSSSSSKEVSATGGGVPNGSGEVVIITAGRSKVKEYKPQVIANQTHLLAFDKVVAPVDGESVKESPILVESNASPTTTSTTKSPLEDFDAMQLLHSWLNKA